MYLYVIGNIVNLSLYKIPKKYVLINAKNQNCVYKFSYIPNSYLNKQCNKKINQATINTILGYSQVPNNIL